MKRIVETKRVIKETIYYCDICGSGKKTHCCKCGIDLCNKCVFHEEDDPGEYRGNCYCKDCYELGTEYREQIAALELQIEFLSEEYTNKCKQKAK